MGARGKKPQAALSVVKPGAVTAVERPEAPGELTDEQAAEWRAIVDRMPADWFPRETHGLLAQYCRHVVAARRVAQLLEQHEKGEMETEDWLSDYDKLLKFQEREGRAMSSLATRMRISQQAQYSHKKKTGTGAKKPF